LGFLAIFALGAALALALPLDLAFVQTGLAEADIGVVAEARTVLAPVRTVKLSENAPVLSIGVATMP
jgi:hypothetical protein